LPLQEQNNQRTRQALIEEAISKLSRFANFYDIDSLFVVGDYCREHYLGSVWKTPNINVVSAYNDQALQLGGLFASEFIKVPPVFHNKTKTTRMEYKSEIGSILIEFQGDSVKTYMKSDDVKDWMKRTGIEDIPLLNNIYGRDFTINSLIYSLNNKHMYDPTDLAILNFDKKVIKSLLPPDMLIKCDPLAALKAIEFAMLYDFRIEPGLRHAIKLAGVDNLKASLSEKNIVKAIVKILTINAEKGLDILKNLELDRILFHPDVKKYLEKGFQEN